MLIEELETPSKILLSRFNKKYKLFKESPFFIRPQTKSKNKCKSPLKTTKETTEKVPKEVTEETTEKVPKEVPKEVTEEVTEETTEKVTEKVPKEVPKEVTEETTEKVTEKVPEEVTEKVPEKVTEEVTEEELEGCEHTIYKSPWYIKISKVDEDFIIELHNKKYYKESEITTIVNRLLDYSGVALMLGYYTTKHTDFFEWSIPFQIINITWPLLFGYIFGKYITLIYIFSKIF